MISVGKRVGGFTIIEVMIVLASTGALLIIAMTVIGGQVASTNFQTGTRSFATQLQNIANQVTSGQYTYDNSISCYVDNQNPPEVQIDGNGNANQGSNQECVFLGKNIYIGPTPSNMIYSYIVAAPSNNATISTSDKIIVKNNEIDKYSLSSNLRIKCVFYDSGSCGGTNNMCGLGIIASTNDPNNGTSLDLYKMNNNDPDPSPPCYYPDPSQGGGATCGGESTNQLCSRNDSGFSTTNKIKTATFCVQQIGSSRILGITITSNANNTSNSGNTNIQGSGFSVNIGTNASC